MNADGWGVGWWDPHVRTEPARYRTASPMWTDRSFRSVAEVVHAGAFMAAVRSATPPSPIVDTGNAPFAAESVAVLPQRLRARLPWPGRRGPPPARQPTSVPSGSTARSDSEVLFALVLDSLDAGATPEAGARRG